jgi:hypothetical protein
MKAERPFPCIRENSYGLASMSRPVHARLISKNNEFEYDSPSNAPISTKKPVQRRMQNVLWTCSAQAPH